MTRRHAQRHAYADLPTLGLDDAAGEVRGGQRGAEQHEDREDVVNALVALGILVQEPAYRILGDRRGAGGDRWELPVQRAVELAREMRRVHARSEADDELG